MGILNWVQNKFNAKQERNRPEMDSNIRPNLPPPDQFQKEELSDWPQGFLSIGTLGNQEIKQEEMRPEETHPDRDSRISRDYSQSGSHEYARASQDLPDFTIEEVKKLQDALTKLLKRKPKSGDHQEDHNKVNLPLDRFLNCPSSLEVERTEKKETHNNNDDSDDRNNEMGDLSPHTKMILYKARDLLVNDKKAMKHKSVKFLLKKLFVCGGGFVPRPGPSLRDPTPESRMDKLIRTVLPKKMFSQSNGSSSSRKKFLANKAFENRFENNDDDSRSSNRHKWVKTDSEYIVLEI